MKQNIVQSLVERVAAMDKRLQNLERLRAAPNLAMRDLTDTQIASLSNNQGLVWDTRKQTWVPADPADVAFTFAGAQPAPITSPPYTPRDTIVAVGLSITAGTAGATGSTVVLQRQPASGGTVGSVLSVALSANTSYLAVAMPSSTPGNFNGRLDAMTVALTPGAGLADVVVTVELG